VIENAEGKVMRLRTWPFWIGIIVTITAVVSMVIFDMSAASAGAAPGQHTAFSESVQQGLRIAFLLIAIGAVWHLRRPIQRQWIWAVGAALIVLACSVVADLAGVFVRPDLLSEQIAGLDAANSFERRLLRLGATAAYAVPMLALLAVGGVERDSVGSEARVSATPAKWLVRWEPILFTVGVVTLPGFLIAAAFVNREFVWLVPIGADTTVAACVAVAIRARRGADGFAFTGWLLICISMGIGLLMGIYSFGGPVPPPAFIGEYDAWLRTILRDSHVLIMSVGFIVVAFAAVRRPFAGVA